MTLSEWAEAAEVKLAPPNDKGHVCIDIRFLDRDQQMALLQLDDWFLQSPPRHQFPAAVAWMTRRARVLDRAPQPKEATRGQRPQAQPRRRAT